MSSSSESKAWGLRGHPLYHANLMNDPLPSSLQTAFGEIGVLFERASTGSSWSGKTLGMDILTIDTGRLKTVLLPDRGMSIWKCWIDETEFGWQSPVDGPVHPSFVPVHDSSGIGWLEGFDELFVRCGLKSNGAPEFHENGTLRYPLHGRIANLPASDLHIVVTPGEGILDVIAHVTEARFLVYSLNLQTKYRFRAGSPIVEITDTVTNPLSQPVTMQMLYHINVGQPVVEAGAMIHSAYKSMCPRDQTAAKAIGTWNRCEGPVSGFAEQVYFQQAIGDEQAWAEAMIASENESTGFSVCFDTRTLPYLNLWKNTAAVEDGYVVGLEPATGFPNPYSFEEKQQRVVTLSGGESRVFRLKIEPMLERNRIEFAKQRIAQRNTGEAMLHKDPQSGWTL